MDFLKKQLDTIQQNLSGLNATQKMLTGALVAIMVMTMVFWSRYAGTAEMEPVLNQTLSEDDLARMSAALDARGISNKVSGGKVLVASDRKMQALAELGYQQLMPRNSKSGFDEMFSKLNAFSSPQDREAAFNRGREMTLAQIINGFPNVASADVMIDASNSRNITRGDVTPSATINIRTRGGESDKKLVNAAADLVMGAVSTINRTKIKVVVDGRSTRLQNSDDGIEGGGNILESMQAWEASRARLIEEQLDYLGHVRVSVTGTLNVETQSVRKREIDAKKASVQPLSTENRTMESNTAGGGSKEAGAQPNIGGLSIDGAGGSSTTVTDTTDKVQNKVDVPETWTTSTRPAGEFTAQQASVRVPRNYFVSMLKDQSGGKDPSPSEVDAAIQAALQSIKQTVKACANIKNMDDVFVDTYYEVSPTGGSPAVAGIAGSGGGIAAIVGGWGKELGVGVLAVISLFMVSTMVRKSTPAPLVIQTPEKPSPAALVGGEDVAGMATAGGPALAGMELDDDTIQTQQILDQVQNMVGEDPDAAANLVKRWMNRQ